MGVRWQPCSNYRSCGVSRLADTDGWDTHRSCLRCGRWYCNPCAQTFISPQPQEGEACVYCKGEKISDVLLLRYALMKDPNLLQECQDFLRRYQMNKRIQALGIPWKKVKKITIVDTFGKRVEFQLPSQEELNIYGKLSDVLP